jgi:exopolysaccharide biosynthesis WecB/TagA/CpsF family protein
MVQSLRSDLPELRIAGAEASKFRAAGPGEGERIARRVRASGARLMLVGLGCPRQEDFTYSMRPRLQLPLLAVGAAFAYQAGELPRPPAWMQRWGLEWLWRLLHEPRRLWRRYLLLNPAYLTRLAAQKAHLWRAAPPPTAPAPQRSFAV